MDGNFHLHPGDLVIYQNGDRFEVGKIKTMCKDRQAAFVWYHEGDTASMTPCSKLSRIANAYALGRTRLGGESAREMGL